MVLLDWYIFVFGGASLVYIYGLAIDLVGLCFSESILPCVYVCCFSVFVCFFWFSCVLLLVMTLNSQ